MKRYQVRRWDKRNTLIFKKYSSPFWFMMKLLTIGMLYSMFFV
jgi:hypothetical protein